MERTTTDPVVGRLLDGRYRVERRIARGGMATVYEATDTRLDRTVAVKVMHAGLGDDEAFSRRFRREAQAAARLAHHNVVAVFDQGDDDGTLFLVMENVPGITLRDLVRAEAPMPPVRALSVIEPVLAALSAAHAAGMIHRDVKPENVLLSDDGRVKVADFGLARAVNAETQHTNTGVLIGTVSYLSPELVVAGEADARADVYAAGVIVYEMLTGQKPHTAESPIQVAYKHVHEDIPPPSSLQPSLPPYVDALVARATARDASLRPTDAGVLLHQVRRVRNALEAGVVEDPDLVADLLPHLPPRDPFEDTDDQMAQAIIDPSADTGAWSPHDGDDAGFPLHEAGAAAGAAGAVGALGPFSVDDVYDQENEATSRVGTTGPPILASPLSPGPPRGPSPPEAVRPLPPPRRPSRRGPVVLVLALVTALVIGLGVFWFGFARYTTTPGVINLSQAAAKAKVTAAGLTFEVAGQGYSETVPKGAVLSTDPRAGSRILKDGTVRAVVSRGAERHAVPAVRGKTLDQAQQLIQDAELSYGQTVGRYSETVPKGRVIASQPAAGTQLRRDAAVDVVVSKGRRPIEVPDVTGKSAADARGALAKLGLRVESSSDYSDDVDKGDVVSQDPKDGTLFKGDTVTLVVSKGPPLVEVPRVQAMGYDAAKELLESKGFVVKAKRSDSWIGLRYVLRQSPGAGDKAPRGSTVTLYLV